MGLFKKPNTNRVSEPDIEAQGLETKPAEVQTVTDTKASGTTTPELTASAAAELAADSAANANTVTLSKFTLYRRRFLRNKPACIGLVLLTLLILFAVLGGVVARYDYTTPDFLSLNVPPNADHWFGTDDTGIDLYAQVVHGTGLSLFIAIVVSCCTVTISAVIGATAAYLGGRPEKVILTIIHFLLIIPSFLILALVVSHFGGDWIMLTISLIAFGWMYSSRVIWSLALSIREREYVSASRFMGVRGWRIIVRHIIPNIGSLLIVNLTLGVVSTVMSETGLSFLGLGVQIPNVSLGTLLSSGANLVEYAPWRFFFPAGALTILTVSMALIADGLRDALDPNSQSGGAA